MLTCRRRLLRAELLNYLVTDLNWRASNGFQYGVGVHTNRIREYCTRLRHSFSPPYPPSWIGHRHVGSRRDQLRRAFSVDQPNHTAGIIWHIGWFSIRCRSHCSESMAPRMISSSVFMLATAYIPLLLATSKVALISTGEG